MLVGGTEEDEMEVPMRGQIVAGQGKEGGPAHWRFLGNLGILHPMSITFQMKYVK